MSYRVTSHPVRCLLSEKPTFVDLHGYCDFESMLAYRLDTDVALVYVSALSVIKGTGNTMATVELIRKVDDNDKSVFVAITCCRMEDSADELRLFSGRLPVAPQAWVLGAVCEEDSPHGLRTSVARSAVVCALQAANL